MGWKTKKARRAYLEKNRERIAEQKRKWNAANREHNTAMRRKWREANRERDNANARKRRETREKNYPQRNSQASTPKPRRVLTEAERDARRAASYQRQIERVRKWHAENRERSRALSRAYYAANRERLLEMARQYRERKRMQKAGNPAL